jgi:hypothetical protein
MTKKLDMLITSPQPSLDNLGNYESEDYISHTDSKRSLFENITCEKHSPENKLQLINKQ